MSELTKLLERWKAEAGPLGDRYLDPFIAELEAAVAAERARIRQQLEQLPRYHLFSTIQRDGSIASADLEPFTEGEWVEVAALQRLLEEL